MRAIQYFVLPGYAFKNEHIFTQPTFTLSQGEIPNYAWFLPIPILMKISNKDKQDKYIVNAQSALRFL